mmetsp:Transcript_4281/g.6903  ORF Transcript_4281/g.6903 Transcript_4281/m.6903 type:complete len:546 (+) Transcript_4281:9-1646(+)
MAPKSFTLKQIKDKITALVAEQLGVRTIGTDVTLMDTGLTSMATTELSIRLSKEFGVKIRPTIVFTSPTIDDISERVLELVEVRREEAGVSTSKSVEEYAATETAEEDNERYEAHIASWGIATPFPISTERYLEIDRRERQKKGQPESVIKQMATFVKSSRIHNRHSCHPFFLPDGDSPEDYPDAVGTMKTDIYGPHPDHNPPLITRMGCYPDTAVKMCVAAAEKAVKNWGLDRSEITHVLTTCTSGWSEPGIGCAVIKTLGLSEDIQKAELNFNGCFCGATCLRLANDIIKSGSGKAVLLVACEVSTSHFDWGRTDTELMIAQSLFADGAASLVVAKEGIWKYTKTGSAIVPNSSHLLGLKPPLKDHETCYVMTLSKLVSPSLYAYFSKGHGKDILKTLYNPREPKPALAIHPGGPRILEAVGDVFFELGWKEDALDASYETFGYFGNLGSAAMLFVLANRLGKNDIKEDKLITMAFGPGVTVEYALLERSSASAKKAKKSSSAVGQTATKQNATSMMMLIMMVNTIVMLAFGVFFVWKSGALN